LQTNTPKAFANLSPVVEAQRQPWDHPQPTTFEPCKGYARAGLTLTGLIFICINSIPGLSLSFNHWA